VVDATSPYAPGTVGDEPALPRAARRAAPFVLAAFVFALIGPGLLAPSWTLLLVGAGIATRGSSSFYILAATPTALSVAWGLLSDRWRILETRREGHLLLSAMLVAGAWVAALLLVDIRPLVVAAMGAITAAKSIAGAAIGGALVEIGRRRSATGRLAAAWLAAVAVADLAEVPVTAILGMALSPGKVGLCVGAGVVTGIVALVSSEIGRAAANPASVPPPLRTVLRTRALWASAAVLALAAIASVPTSAIATGRWPDDLLRALYVGQLAGAGCYAFGCQRMPLARAGQLALMLNVFVIIAFVRSSDQTHTGRILPVVALGVVYGFKFGALTDLLFRASARGHEAFACALLTAVYVAASEALGLFAKAFDLSVPAMTSIAAVAGVAAMLSFRWLPASLVAWRDGDPAPA
jgi:hypothetical protein